MKSTVKYAAISAIGTAVYVSLIASVMFFAEKGLLGSNRTILIPIAMLMLFVFSAAFTGFLVFGRPIIWYWDGKKKEALALLFYTLGIFLAITLIVFLLLLY